MAKLGKLRSALAVLGMTSALVVPGSAIAQDVTLTSYDGSISLKGRLVEFDGDNYRLATAIGEITIDAFQVACEGEGCPAPELLASEVVIAGSQSIGSELMPALVEGYAFALDADISQSAGASTDALQINMSDLEGRAMADIEIAALGAGGAFRGLLGGDAAIGMSSRPVRPREAQVLEQAGLGNLADPANEHILALDGIITVVHRSNPVRAISTENMAAVFAGQITNWAQLGGPDAPINLYVRDEESGTRSVFESLIMAPAAAQMAERSTVLDSNSELSDAVAADPYGIGFTGFADERNARALGIQEVCGIVTQATPFTIKAEEYPLARRLYLYTTDKAIPPHAKSLLEFATSDDAQDIISSLGFIDQGISSEPVNNQGLRFASSILSAQNTAELLQLRDMAATLVNAERMSTTFRFQPGSSLLDNKAQRDVVRIAEMISRGDFENKDVMLVGFTDSIGRPDLNEALSFRRADQVRQAILESLPDGALQADDINVLGYGEVSPVGCNETFNGRRINRRVEIWVRDKV